jgi:hypothetical protein
MDFSKLTRAEGIASSGGVLLAISLFLHWYHATTHPGAPTTLGGHVYQNPVALSAWDVHPIMRILLLLAAAAPLILAYIVARGHALSWPRGEMTAVVSIFAFGLIAYNAFIAKPGSPRGEISLRFGILVAIVATALMLIGAATRTGEVERRRKPPGTI